MYASSCKGNLCWYFYRSSQIPVRTDGKRWSWTAYAMSSDKHNVTSIEYTYCRYWKNRYAHHSDGYIVSDIQYIIQISKIGIFSIVSILKKRICPSLAMSLGTLNIHDTSLSLLQHLILYVNFWIMCAEECKNLTVLEKFEILEKFD